MLRAVRTAVLCLALGGCGFSTPGGPFGPGDAGHVSDSPIASGDANATDAVSIDAMADAASCPANFVALPSAGTSSKYLVFSKSSQLGAVTTCAGLGTHLARLDTQAEATALESYIASNSGGSPTGLYRVVGARDPVLRGLWHDLDFITLLSFLPWGQSEPTDVFLGGEDCIVLKHEQNSAVIGAQECSSQHEFACECD